MTDHNVIFKIMIIYWLGMFALVCMLFAVMGTAMAAAGNKST